MARTAEQYIREVVASLVKQVDDAPTAVDGALMAHQIVTAWYEARSDLSRLRTAKLREAEASRRVTRRELGSLLGVSHQRVTQMLDQPRGTKSRAFGKPGRVRWQEEQAREQARLQQAHERKAHDQPIRTRQADNRPGRGDRGAGAGDS